MVKVVAGLTQPAVLVCVTEKLCVPTWLMSVWGGLGIAPFTPEKLSVLPFVALTNWLKGSGVLLWVTVRLTPVSVGAAGGVLTVTETLAVAVQPLVLLTVTE